MSQDVVVGCDRHTAQTSSRDIITRSRRRAILVFVGCCVMQAVGIGTIANSSSAYFAYVPSAIGIGMGEFSLWFTSYGVACLFGSLLAASLYPRFGAKVMVSVCVVVSALAVAAFSLCTTGMHFLIVGAILGIVGGAYFLYATPVLMNTWFHESCLGRYLGIAQLCSGIGGAIFPGIFTTLFPLIGYQGVYLLNAVLILTILAFSLTVFGDDPASLGLVKFGSPEVEATPDEVDAQNSDAGTAGVPARYILGTPAFVVAMVACALCAFGGNYTAYIQSNAINVLGEEYAGFSATLMTASQVGYIVMTFVSGFVFERLGATRTTVALSAVFLASLLGFAFLSTPMPMLVCAFFFGMNSALLTMSVPMLIKEFFGNRDYQRIFAYSMTGGCLMGCLGTSIIGFIFDATGTYSGTFVAGAVIVAVNIVLMLVASSLCARLREQHWEEA